MNRVAQAVRDRRRVKERTWVVWIVLAWVALIVVGHANSEYTETDRTEQAP